MPHDAQRLWQDHTHFQCVEEVASSACPRTLSQCLRVGGLWTLVTFPVPPPFLCSWEPMRYGTVLTIKQNLYKNAFYLSLICNLGLPDLWAKKHFHNVCCSNLYLLLYTLSDMHTLLWYTYRSDHWPEISNKGLSWVTEDYDVRFDHQPSSLSSRDYCLVLLTTEKIKISGTQA